MVQFSVLSGRQAGARRAARRFPVRLGRAAANDLQFDDPGVWDEHLELNLRPAEGFLLAPRPNALTRVNGQPVQSVLLRNGDCIEFGSVKLQFWLGEARQRGLRGRELFVWTLLLLVTLSQFALIYRLVP